MNSVERVEEYLQIEQEQAATEAKIMPPSTVITIILD